MTVAELCNRMGGRELRLWQTYYNIEPFGQWRDNMHAGIIASSFINSQRSRGQKVADPDNYMLRIRKTVDPKTQEQTLKAALNLRRKQ